MPESTEMFRCAGSFLRTEGFFNEVILNSQISFACEPDCVSSCFGSTQMFLRHSGLDETLTEGFAWREILIHRFLNLTEENSESHPGPSRDNKNF